MRPALSQAQCDGLHLPPGRCDRKVFGLGISKTGTTSLAALAKRMGLKAGHWVWQTFAKVDGLHRPKLELLDAMDFADDLPLAFFFDELAARYPRAEFILTERGLASWLDSMTNHIRTVQANNQISQINNEFAYSTNSPSEVWMLQHGALRQYRQVLAAVHPARLLLVNLVETVDFGLASLEVCQLLGVPQSGCVRTPTVANAHGQFGLDLVQKQLQAIKARAPASAIDLLQALEGGGQ
jgi:hypothetical protein